MSASQLSFADQLSALCAAELAAARQDADRMGEMVERLVNALAFSISIMGAGNPKVTSELLQGAEAYLTEAASGHLKVAAFLESDRK